MTECNSEDCECDYYEDEEPELGQRGSFENPLIRAKWSIDGATTMDEVLEKLDDFKAWIKDLKADGWEIDGEVDDDYGHTYKKEV